MDELVWRFLVDDLALDLCFEVRELRSRVLLTDHHSYLSISIRLCTQMHQRVKVDGMSIDELYDVEPVVRKRASRSLARCCERSSFATSVC